MKYNFKKNINDEVWVMHEDKPQVCLISKMRYAKYISPVDFELTEYEKYTLSSKLNGEYVGQFDLSSMFDTKEDLIKSL